MNNLIIFISFAIFIGIYALVGYFFGWIGFVSLILFNICIWYFLIRKYEKRK